MDGGVDRRGRGNLPVELTSFVGRDRELAAIGRGLAASRLLTLVGPGGVGKTRLALRAAHNARRAFPDGIWMVDLSTLRDPTLLAEHVAASLGLRDESGRWLVGTLSDHLARRRLLMVLDNCEHLLDSCAALVRAVLQGGSQLRILATSREPVGLTGEMLIQVTPLDVEGPALELLADRAAAARPEFRLTESTRPAAIELCRRLDGVPLAVELAAARLRGMALDEVVARLGDRFSLLTSGDRSAPARQQTLRAALDWSHDLLPDEERIVWRRLSVFAGTFDLDAVTAVCSDDNLPADRVTDAVTHLAERSMVQFDDALVGRYRLLETLREYAAEKAAQASETEWLAVGHREYFLNLAKTASATWSTRDQVPWFRRLSMEYDNLRQALESSRHDAHTAALAADAAARLWLWWQVAGRVGEGRKWLAALAERLPGDADERRIALFAAGYLALSQRDMQGATTTLNAALGLARDADDEEVEALAIGYLGLVRLFEGAHAESRSMFLDAAERHRRGGRNGMAAFHIADAAIAATLLGDPSGAMVEFEQSIREARERGDAWTESHAMFGVGLARLSIGEAREAEQAMRDSLVLIRHVGDATGVALALEGLATTAAAQGDAERAARLTGLADSYWDAIPASPPGPIVAMREGRLAQIRAKLDDRRFAAAVAAARAIDPADAVAEALGERRIASDNPPSQGPKLSSREQEVAGLVVRGLSNREIAERLVLSPRTVESHVERIMNRLGVNSRAEIAAWMARSESAEQREMP